MPLYKYKCEKCGNIETLMCNYCEKVSMEKKLKCGKCGFKHFLPIFTKTLVTSNEKPIPEEHPPGSKCHSCSVDSCDSCM